ncbi:GNAT family N-acyltransferase [Ectothiorhodospira mobilis]|nr:GNAT family N-acyltransferase [Ectothiorhodospira mobilis]
MSKTRYEVFVADTPGTRRIHHAIRYSVYCLERGFEDPGEFPDGQERDPWDAQATAFTVRDRETGLWVGAMRLVHPLGGHLPVHRLTRLRREYAPTSTGGATELSRICITKGFHAPGNAGSFPIPVQRQERWGSDIQGRLAAGMGCRTRRRVPLFRSRPADGGEYLGRHERHDRPDVDGGEPETKGGLAPVERSELFAVMLRAAIEYSRDHEIPFMYFLVNRALARMVRRLGFTFSQAGVPCEHRGIRYPYLAHLDTAVDHAVRSSPDMARLFLQGEVPYRFASSGDQRGDGGSPGAHKTAIPGEAARDLDSARVAMG